MNRAMMRGLFVPAALALATASAAVGQTRLDREGTVGLSVFGDYATITGESRLGLDFKSGAGYGLNIRYTLGPHWALGLGFHNQSYDAVNEVKGLGVDEMVSTEVIGEIYYYRDRNTDAPQYLMMGLGFYRPEIIYEDEDILFPGENLVVTAGLGVEVFIRETWGLDLSARGFGYLGEGIADQERDGAAGDGTPITAQGSFAVGLQAQVGLIYYLTR